MSCIFSSNFPLFYINMKKVHVKIQVAQTYLLVEFIALYIKYNTRVPNLGKEEMLEVEGRIEKLLGRMPSLQQTTDKIQLIKQVR